MTMKIIISPAKKMNVNTDIFPCRNLPVFMEAAKKLLDCLQRLTYEEAKAVWNCSDKLAALNYDRLQTMDLEQNLTPAILSYEGIQYQYMAPGVFTTEAYEYVEEHLRILSGFYGMLRPFDGVTPYRLEMQARLGCAEIDSLYDFWGGRIASKLFEEADTVLNLASKEYSKCVSAYLPEDKRMITCVFGELIEGKVKEKGTMVKMARGEMVRYMAENHIEDVEEIKGFDRLGYTYAEALSDQQTYVFLK